MNRFFKTALAIFAAIYVISPWDALPGPIDDIVVMIGTYFINKKITERAEKVRPNQGANGKIDPENFVYADYKVE